MGEQPVAFTGDQRAEASILLNRIARLECRHSRSSWRIAAHSDVAIVAR
jgi:hypothetical protein